MDDLLDVSRITRGKINLSRETVEVADLVARAVETVQPLIVERGHRLTLDVARESIRVFGDPLRLTQALGNVLSNAAKYTENGGQISLTARQVDGIVEIRVQDTGIGIPSDLQPMIFDMFTQLNHQTGRAQSGLGIGLALVRKLLEMHGGSVTAFSEGNGRGSEFLITLPVITNETNAANGRAAVALDSDDGRRSRSGSAPNPGGGR